MFPPTCHTLALLAISPLLTTISALRIRESTATDITVFNPPTLSPFLQLTTQTILPVNISTIYGTTARYPNLGGNITGALQGEIVPLGAAFELLPPAANGTVGLYTNQFTLNVTCPNTDTFTTILMDAKATITYANNALHGFGTVSFFSDAPEYIDLN